MLFIHHRIIHCSLCLGPTEVKPLTETGRLKELPQVDGNLLTLTCDVTWLSNALQFGVMVVADDLARIWEQA